MLAFSSDWTTLAGWRGLKTRLNSLRYTKDLEDAVTSGKLPVAVRG